MTNIDWMEKLTKQERLDSLFLKVSQQFAKMSHCIRVNVGAVVVRDGRIVTTGYNGSPPGYENCDHHFEEWIKLESAGSDGRWEAERRETFINSDLFKERHGLWSKHEVHAEQNAILHAARNGVSCAGSTLYTTISPCMDCAKAILISGIVRVVYIEEYDRDNYPLTFLKECGVLVEKGIIYDRD